MFTLAVGFDCTFIMDRFENKFLLAVKTAACDDKDDQEEIDEHDEVKMSCAYLVALTALATLDV